MKNNNLLSKIMNYTQEFIKENDLDLRVKVKLGLKKRLLVFFGDRRVSIDLWEKDPQFIAIEIRNIMMEVLTFIEANSDEEEELPEEKLEERLC